jgi:hypothetical protein
MAESLAEGTDIGREHRKRLERIRRLRAELDRVSAASSLATPDWPLRGGAAPRRPPRRAR